MAIYTNLCLQYEQGVESSLVACFVALRLFGPCRFLLTPAAARMSPTAAAALRDTASDDGTVTGDMVGSGSVADVSETSITPTAAVAMFHSTNVSIISIS